MCYFHFISYFFFVLLFVFQNNDAFRVRTFYFVPINEHYVVYEDVNCIFFLRFWTHIYFAISWCDNVPAFCFHFRCFGVVSIRRTRETLTSEAGVNGMGCSSLSSVCLQSRTHAIRKMVLFGNVRKMTNEINLHMTPDDGCVVCVAANKQQNTEMPSPPFMECR